MKKYTAFVEIFQKNDIDGKVRQVCFDFGDDILTARHFVEIADEALTRYNIYFQVMYKEAIINEE